MTRLRVGLIGFGSWAQKAYGPALIADSGVDVVAVAARTEQTHTAARELLGTKFQSYTNYDDLLSRADIDAIIIGVPTDASAAAALAALKAGKHTFVEPPLEDCDITNELLELATSTNKVFHVDLETRYLPIVETIRKVIKRNEFGVLRTINVHLENNWADHLALDDAGQASRIMGLSTWYIAPIDLFVGHVPETAEIVGADQQVGHVTLTYHGGPEAVWHFNLRTRDELSLRMEVASEYGVVEADLLTGNYHWHMDSDSGSGNAPCLQPPLGFVGMRESIHAFLSAISGDRQTGSGSEVYMRVHTTIKALTRSQAGNTPVTV